MQHVPGLLQVSEGFCPDGYIEKRVFKKPKPTINLIDLVSVQTEL